MPKCCEFSIVSTWYMLGKYMQIQSLPYHAPTSPKSSDIPQVAFKIEQLQTCFFSFVGQSLIAVGEHPISFCLISQPSAAYLSELWMIFQNWYPKTHPTQFDQTSNVPLADTRKRCWSSTEAPPLQALSPWRVETAPGSEARCHSQGRPRGRNPGGQWWRCPSCLALGKCHGNLKNSCHYLIDR